MIARTRTTTSCCGGTTLVGKTAGGGCGQAGCSCGTPLEVCPDDAYVRPRFFSGQLLTEDDLELLVGYVTQKQRLHNRYLFGAGVVCGLSVASHPCRGGKIVVEPGYALDCCGNDLVLDCPQVLDVNQMIQALRIESLGGFDCGDPCAALAEPAPVPPPPAPEAQPAAAEEAAPAPLGVGVMSVAASTARAADLSAGREPATALRSDARRYGLYLRYHETPSDPVSPYATDEPCAVVECEPTRIREGVSFELRCAQKTQAEPDLFVHLMRCLAALLGAEKPLASVAQAQKTFLDIESADKAIRSGAAVTISPQQQATLGYDVTALERVVERGVPQGAEQVREAVGLIRSAGAATARIWFVPREARAELLNRSSDGKEPLFSVLNRSHEAIINAGERLGPDVLRRHLQGVELLEALATADYATRFTEPGKADSKELPEQRWMGEGPPGIAQSDVARLFAEGAVYEVSAANAAFDGMLELRERLLVQTDRGGFASDATLVNELSSIALLKAEAPSRAEAVRVTVVAKRFERVLLRSILDCLCAAFQVPCPPACDDVAVPLATLTVDNCEVTQICNTARTHVLSSRALRYWLPPLNALGAVLEFVCCDLRGVFGPHGSVQKSVLGRWLRQDQDDKTTLNGDALAPDLVLALEALYGPEVFAADRAESFARSLGHIGSVAGVHLAGGAQPALVRRDADTERLVEQVVASPTFGDKLKRELDANVNTWVAEGRLDIGPSLEQAVSGVRDTLRAERALALRTQLDSFVKSQESTGFRAAVKPVIDEQLDTALLVLPARVDASIRNEMVNLGLTGETLERRIGNRVTERLAEEGLTRDALTARLNGTIDNAFVSRGLSAEGLNTRIRETLSTELSRRGLGEGALDARLDSRIQTLFASAGLTEEALTNRIQGQTLNLLNARGLSEEAFTTRVNNQIIAQLEKENLNQARLSGLIKETVTSLLAEQPVRERSAATDDVAEGLGQRLAGLEQKLSAFDEISENLKSLESRYRNLAGRMTRVERQERDEE